MLAADDRRNKMLILVYPRLSAGQNFIPRPAKDWKPMPLVGPGVIEIRVHLESEYRVFYLAKFEEAVYVLHAFVKKTQKSSSLDIALGKKRYRELLERRK